MRKIKLTQGKVAIVDDEDFEYLNRWKWCAHKNKNIWYVMRGKRIGERTITIYMHRIVLGITDKTILCDHIDRDGLNNQRNNLRICGNRENILNSISRKNSSSKYKGVCFNKNRNKWEANIRKDNKQLYLGTFKSEKEAAFEYNKKAIELHGEFANINNL